MWLRKVTVPRPEHFLKSTTTSNTPTGSTITPISQATFQHQPCPPPSLRRSLKPASQHASLRTSAPLTKKQAHERPVSKGPTLRNIADRYSRADANNDPRISTKRHLNESRISPPRHPARVPGSDTYWRWTSAPPVCGGEARSGRFRRFYNYCCSGEWRRCCLEVAGMGSATAQQVRR
jgi:hypothetical protein